MELAEDEVDDKKDELYSWEKEYERSWDLLTEDEKGLRSLLTEKKRKKAEQKDSRKIRRGLTRHLFLVLDFSKSLLLTDLKPSRLTLTLNIVEAFILNYFDQNPLSQLGIIITRNSVAEKLTELSGNPSKHIKELRAQTLTEGEPSLQNALEVARSSLSYIPKYGSREILLLFESLTTCDPGDIFETVETLKKENIQCSVIGVGAEVHVCKAIAQASLGTYRVALSEEHFKELLLSHTPPPPATTKTETALIRMGFPQRVTDAVASLCVCHQVPKYTGYLCPQCHSKCCELPSDCPICNLTLVSSPHLARSYHHLFPVPVYTESASSLGSAQSYCMSCQTSLHKQPAFSCPKCSNSFCADCDDYIHDSLHNCPGCEMLSAKGVSSTTSSSSNTSSTSSNTSTHVA